MYAVTAEYAENIAKTVRYTGVTGYVQAKSGTSYPITDDNISANSLVIKRALNKRGDYRPGGVAAAEMSIGLLGFGDLADNLNGARIVLFFDLYRTAAMEEYDRVPLGVFFVDGSQIKRKYSTVKLKAYDGMLKFDIAASALTGTLYELLETACAACGVYLDITQEEFEALPNGTMTVTIDTARIQTWRDFLMYVGLLTGCWCRMRRDSPNELEIVKLTCERDENSIIQVQRNIAGDNRFSTEFSDDKIYITKLSTRHNGSLVEQTRKITWVGENITMLAQLELVENPLLRNKTEDEVVEALNNIIIQITQCALRTFSTDFNGDPALDVGDYVQLDGGAIDIKQNSTGSGFENGYIRVFITSQVWRYRGKHRLECKLPTLMEANATAATLADEESEEPMRVTPKSQIEKRLDGIEAQLGGGGGTASRGVLNSYKYLSDNSIKYNDLTYTVEKDESGLISRIYDDDQGEFLPEISGEITDIAFHNAVFTAIAMLCGLPKPEAEDTLTEMVQYRYNNDVSVVDGSSISWSNQAVGADNSLVWTGSSKQDGGIYITGAKGSVGTLTYAPDVQAVDEYTIYLVARGVTASSVRFFNSSGSGSLGTAASIYSDSGLWRVTNYVNGNPLASSGVPSTSKAVVVMRRKTDGSLEYWVNGNLIDSAVAGVQLIAGSFSFGWTFALSGLYDGNGFYFYDFALAETAHSEADIITNSKYLMAKYNITT